MKKLSIILSLCLGLMLLAGCSGSTAQTTEAETESEETVSAAAVDGGWEILDATSSLTTEEAEVFEKAAAEWDGTDLEPVVVIATQVVSGTNYCYLAKATTVTAQPTSHYAFVYVYADLQGNAEISGIKDIEISTDDAEDEGESTEGLAGGWTLAELDGITVQNQDKFEAAFEEFVGSDLSPVACLATQLVSGTNYCFLVKETRVTAQPVSYIALAYVYENLQGETEILNIHTIDYMPEN